MVTNNKFNGFGVAVDTTSSPVTATTGAIIDGNTITAGGIGIQLGAFTEDAVVSNNLFHGNTTDLQNNVGNTFQNFVDIPQDCSAASGFRFGGASTGITYSLATCQVATVNRQTFVDIDYTFSSVGSASGAATFQLPSVANSSLPGGSMSFGFVGGMTGLSGPLSGVVNQTSSTVTFGQWTSGGTASLTNTNFTAATRIQGRVSVRAPSVYP
jgi:hypothetical protein